MRRSLQIVLGVLSLIPVTVALQGLLLGADRMLPAEAVTPRFDSQYRYLSGVYVAVSFTIWWAIPAIEKRGAVVRAVCLGIFVGGIGRLLSIGELGGADAFTIGVTTFELCMPLLAGWQYLVQRRADLSSGVASGRSGG
ncbi:MAG: DUF4345 domain-containing protein [Nocardioides sp.]